MNGGLGEWLAGQRGPALVTDLRRRIISMIYDHRGRDDDQLRALVNAPADALVIRAPESGELDLASMTWRCELCREERPDAQISVAHWRCRGLEDRFPDCRFNLKYCNDREACASVALAGGVWPPPRAGQDG